MTEYQVLTVKCKMLVQPERVSVLDETVSRFTEACNYALKTARDTDTWNRIKLHHLTYHSIRERLGLSANLVVQAIRRVAKKGERAHMFRAGSVEYDARTLSLKDSVLSITTTRGRLKFPLFFGERQRQQLANALTIQGGQLVRTKRGEWYMHLSVRTPVAETKATGRIVGCDFGQRTLAVLSSNGTRYGGGNPKTTRLHYKAKRAEVRTKLDTQRSKGTKRLFARLSGKEARYTRAVLHEVSRRIVDSLEPGDTLAIEDLTGLRKNTTRRGKEARGLHNLWPYFQFRQYLEYKCALKSVTVIAVEARNTSKTCSRCGHCDKANRKRQALFRCVQCGYQDSADKNASLNIAQRAGSLGIGVCNDASNSSVSRTVTVRGLKAA